MMGLSPTIVSLLGYIGIWLISRFNLPLALYVLFALEISLAIFWAQRACAAFAMHHLAVSIYCSLALGLQIEFGYIFWGISDVSSSALERFVSVVTIYCAAIALAYFHVNHTASSAQHFSISIRAWLNELGQRENPRTTAIQIAYVTLAIGLILAKPDLNLATRSEQAGNLSLALRPMEIFIYSFIPKSMLLTAGSISILITIFSNTKHRPAALTRTLLLAPLCFLLASPATTPRQVFVVSSLPFAVAALYIAKQGRLIPIFLWFVICAAGPLINSFARDAATGANTELYPFSSDFDAGIVGAALIEREDYLPPGWGRYLVAALSFFLPGELKPFTEYDPLQMWGGMVFSQTNVSLPPFVTSYLDFGLLGPVALGLGIGLLMRRVEDLAKHQSFNQSSQWVAPLLIIACSYIPFLRGPILGWGPFLLAGLFSNLLFTRTFRKATVS